MKRRDFFGLSAGAAASLIVPAVAAEPGLHVETVTALARWILIDVETFPFLDWRKEEIEKIPSSGEEWGRQQLIKNMKPPQPGEMFLAEDITVSLKRGNIASHTFHTTVDLMLHPAEGLVTFVRGTRLNYAMGGEFIDSVRTVVSYKCR